MKANHLGKVGQILLFEIQAIHLAIDKVSFSEILVLRVY
jgi:hypothetical protein